MDHQTKRHEELTKEQVAKFSAEFDKQKHAIFTKIEQLEKDALNQENKDTVAKLKSEFARLLEEAKKMESAKAAE